MPVTSAITARACSAIMPPEDGDYTWTNPRTGERIRVPEGIDPGFDRNPGESLMAPLWQMLREKVASLPVDMQAAVLPSIAQQAATASAATAASASVYQVYLAQAEAELARTREWSTMTQAQRIEAVERRALELQSRQA